MKEQKILVIGASGNVGSLILKQLSKHLSVKGTYHTNKIENLVMLDLILDDYRSFISEFTHIIVAASGTKKNSTIGIEKLLKAIDCNNQKLIFISSIDIYKSFLFPISDLPAKNIRVIKPLKSHKLLAEEIIENYFQKKMSKNYLIIRLGPLCNEKSYAWYLRIKNLIESGYLPNLKYARCLIVPKHIFTNYLLNQIRKNIFDGCTVILVNTGDLTWRHYFKNFSNIYHEKPTKLRIFFLYTWIKNIFIYVIDRGTPIISPKLAISLFFSRRVRNLNSPEIIVNKNNFMDIMK